MHPRLLPVQAEAAGVLNLLAPVLQAGESKARTRRRPLPLLVLHPATAAILVLPRLLPVEAEVHGEANRLTPPLLPRVGHQNHHPVDLVGDREDDISDIILPLWRVLL